MKLSAEQFFDYLAQIDETLNGVDIKVHHWDDQTNILHLTIGSSEYSEPGITQEEINTIANPLNIEPEHISVHSSAENMYMQGEDDTHALIMSIELPVEEYRDGKTQTQYMKTDDEWVTGDQL